MSDGLPQMTIPELDCPGTMLNSCQENIIAETLPDMLLLGTTPFRHHRASEDMV